jgi:2-dehydropantoate 2-reductase
MNKKRICIVGAGAIGLDLAWHLIKASFQVSIVARGRALEVLRVEGIRRIDSIGGHVKCDDFFVTDDFRSVGTYDINFLCTRVDDLLSLSPQIKNLMHSASVVISCTNGIPPWYSHDQDDTIGRFTFPLEPRNNFLSAIPSQQLIGAVVERSVQLSETGVIKEASGKGFVLGEIDHNKSSRLIEIEEILISSGLGCRLSENIHKDIWLKLILNIAINPLNVLSEGSIGQMLEDDSILDRIDGILGEATLVGVRLGIIKLSDFNKKEFLTFARNNLAHHKSSMLQNYLQGRALEIHRIVEVVQMLARSPGPEPIVETPYIDRLLIDLYEKI